MRVVAAFSLLCAVTLYGVDALPALSFTNTLLQLYRQNVAGLPVYHDLQTWHFKPEEGLVRRERYESLYGPRGEWLIKALGEGEGGFPKLGTDEGAPFKENDKNLSEVALVDPTLPNEINAMANGNTQTDSSKKIKTENKINSS